MGKIMRVPDNFFDLVKETKRRKEKASGLEISDTSIIDYLTKEYKKKKKRVFEL